MCKTATCWGDVITQVAAGCASTPSFSSRERSTAQGGVHSKNNCIKKYMPYQQPCEGLNSLFLMQNKKDRRVLKWEGMCAKEWMSRLYLSLFSCLLPECPSLSWTLISNLKTHFVFHVIYWGSETPVCGLQGLLSTAQSGLHKGDRE